MADDHPAPAGTGAREPLSPASAFRPVFWRMLPAGLAFGVAALLIIIVAPVRSQIEASALGVGSTLAGPLLGGFGGLRVLDRKLRQEEQQAAQEMPAAPRAQ